MNAESNAKPEISAPVMLITGTSKGIGHHLATHYLAKGYRVIGCSRGMVERPEAGYRHIALDITVEQQVVDLFTVVADEFGGIDVLLNNAGISYLAPAVITSAEVALSTLHTNLLGPFLFCREAARLMRRKRSGRIVNFSSVAAPLKSEGQVLYAATKQAVVTMTQVMAREFGPFGVTVNAIGPSLIKTEMTQGMPEKMIEKNLQTQAIKRLGEFADVTNVIDFYLQPASNFITGQVLFLGGIS